jgi:hypothetical protein
MIVQVVIVLASVIILTVVGGEIQMKPFYFNIGSIIYFIILMALVIGVEGQLFRILELKYMKSASAKFYMLKTSVRRSIVVVAVSAAVMVLLLTPFVTNAIADYTSDKGATSTTASFVNRDALGLTTVDRIHVVSGAPAEVMVVAEENYLLYAGDMTALRQHAVVTTIDSSPGLDLAFPHTPFGKYYIVVNSDRPVEVSYTVHKALSPTFVAFMTLFATLFIGFYTIWILTASRIRKNYAKGAIYR